MNNSEQLLSNRSIIKPGKYALITPEGLVENVVPGFENCDITILTTPKLGAEFVDYYVTMSEGGKNHQGLGGDGIETFVYVLEGKLKAMTENKTYSLKEGGYLYCPPEERMYLENDQKEPTKVFLFKKRYKPLGDHKAWIVSSHIEEIETIQRGSGRSVKFLLPQDIAFDLSFNILNFESIASHSIIETHVQEHGALILTGTGMYNLDNQWIPVKKNDYIYMGPYVPQAAYAIGHGNFSYLYSKDGNRDIEL